MSVPAAAAPSPRRLPWDDPAVRAHALNAASIVVIGIQMGRALRAFLDRRRDALPPAAAASAVDAALRAVESLEAADVRALEDELAAELAGGPAFAAALAAARPVGLATGLELTRRDYRLSAGAAGAAWLDARLLEALAAPAPRRGWLGRGEPPRQVVALGAGLCTRPWRLAALPAGVRWAEIDAARGIGAKRRRLAAAGAALAPPAVADRAAGAAAAGAAAHPLCVDSYTAVAGDVAGPPAALLEAVTAAGADLALPVVWLLDGALSFLPPGAAAALLHALAEASAPGSALVGRAVGAAAVGAPPPPGCPYPRSVTCRWAFGLPADPAALFAEAGWALATAAGPADAARAALGGRALGGLFEAAGADGEVLFAARRDRGGA
jgi:O-methyltransferase involved in polyketide biosynthesis